MLLPPHDERQSFCPFDRAEVNPRTASGLTVCSITRTSIGAARRLYFRRRPEIPDDDIGEQVEPAVEEMLATGHYDDGQLLGARPVEHGRERHHVIAFAV